MAEGYKFILKKMNGEYLGELRSGDSNSAEIFMPDEARRELDRIAIDFGRRLGYEPKQGELENTETC